VSLECWLIRNITIVRDAINFLEWTGIEERFEADRLFFMSLDYFCGRFVRR